MIKTHLYDSAEPAVEGSDLIANCRAEVRNSVFVISADDELTNCNIQGAIRHMIGLCSKCKKAPITNRYIYGLQSGQENISQSESSSFLNRKNSGARERNTWQAEQV